MEPKKNGVLTVYTQLPPWAKGVGILLLLLFGYGLTSYIIKSINTAKDKKKEQENLKAFKSDLDSLSSSGIKPTFQESQYRQWADSMASAFTGCDMTNAKNIAFKYDREDNYSDAGATVFRALNQMKNDADFLALQVAYGTRDISKHWWCGGDIKGRTLAGAVDNMLESQEIQGLNMLLKSKNISYTF